MNDPRRTVLLPEFPHPWRRRLRWAVALFVLGAAAFVGLAGFAYYRAGGSLQSAMNEADALDPGWRLEEIQASWPVVHDAENASVKVANLKRITAGRKIDFSADSVLNDLSPEAQLNERQ